MDTTSLPARAARAFARDATAPPPLSLRGASALDSYQVPPPFAPVADEPTDGYLEQFGFWGIGYLDAASWRHYLPRLVAYACAHPDDPAMVIEALVRSLRPPDRYPPRLGSLDPEQEQVLRELLEAIALQGAVPHLREDAEQALQEWWWPNPRSRPTPAQLAALRAEPVTFRSVGGDRYRLLVPETFAGSGSRFLASESRWVETWAGHLCGDVHAVVAVNVTPLGDRALPELADARAGLFRHPVTRREVTVPGASQALRLDGWTHGDSPAEPQRLSIVLAAAGSDVVLLMVRTWSRDDVDRARETILGSLTL